jgi:hypothetical protein
MRPEWMTKNDMQREMIKKIKCQIKQNATSRRERVQVSLDSAVNNKNGTFIIDFNSYSSHSRYNSKSAGSDAVPGQSASPVEIGMPEQDTSTTNGHIVDTHSPPHVLKQIFMTKIQAQLGSFPPECGTVLDILDHSTDNHICSTFFPQVMDFEVDFITKYIDYVFPYLFPFYRPSIFETGRSWLLSLLRNSRIAFHSALSLTSYFFTIALTDAYDDAYIDCSGELWTRLEIQTDSCFKRITTEMTNLNLHDKTATVLEKVHVMESILQTLMFEIVLGRSADWDLHLTPALALFEEVINGPDSHNSLMISALHRIGLPSWYKAEFDHYMWNPDQAGFRFFAALLIFIDIIASTALTEPPRLIQYHLDLLDQQDNGAPILGFTHLRLSTIVGCQNSVILAIGKIATLDAWKKSMKGSESFSMPELIERAAIISTSLVSTIAAVDSNAALERPQDPINLPFQAYSVRRNASAPSNITTRIWAFAAQAYLAVVVCGWQLSNAEVRANVSRILELFDSVSSNHLRTLTWPLCVAGCLASTDQEQSFRKFFTAKKKLELIGSLSEAQQVMEAVWKNRNSVNMEKWDMAACFNVLEKPVLLI